MSQYKRAKILHEYIIVFPSIIWVLKTPKRRNRKQSMNIYHLQSSTFPESLIEDIRTRLYSQDWIWKPLPRIFPSEIPIRKNLVKLTLFNIIQQFQLMNGAIWQISSIRKLTSSSWRGFEWIIQRMNELVWRIFKVFQSEKNLVKLTGFWIIQLMNGTIWQSFFNFGKDIFDKNKIWLVGTLRILDKM